MRENIQKIEIDWGNKRIKCGVLFSISHYDPNLSWRRVCRMIGCGKGIDYGKRCGTKENNKKATEILGLPPKQYARMLRGAQWKLFIQPLLDYGKYSEMFADKLCRGMRGRYNYHKLRMMNDQYDSMEQYMEDGLYHLLPLAMYTGLSTSELKGKLGKSDWKKLCNNSFSRNKLIAELSSNSRDIIESIEMLLPYETTIIKNIFNNGYIRIPYVPGSGEHWAIFELKRDRYLKDIFEEEIRGLNNIFRDTKMMAEQLGESFNSTWSLKKMQEKHDKYSKAITAQKYSREPFDFDFSVVYEFVDKVYPEYKAILLQSPYEIAMQGKQEKHCVGSYASSVKDNKYLIYNIVNTKGETESTLGINVESQNNELYDASSGSFLRWYNYSFRYSQQHRAMNQMPSEKEIEFGQKLIDKLNDINYNDNKTITNLEVENV